jgi:hypothetical protein
MVAVNGVHGTHGTACRAVHEKGQYVVHVLCMLRILLGAAGGGSFWRAAKHADAAGLQLFLPSKNGTWAA